MKCFEFIRNKYYSKKYINNMLIKTDSTCITMSKNLLSWYDENSNKKVKYLTGIMIEIPWGGGPFRRYS